MKRLVLGSAVAATALVLAWPHAPTVVLDRAHLPADGRASAQARVERPTWSGWSWPGRGDLLRIEGLEPTGASVLVAHDGTRVIRAGVRPGVVELSVDGAPGSRRPLTLALDRRDTDGDGLPDAAELMTSEDRAAFTAWFTALAESQAARVDDAWPRVHQDCAGLVRFAFREALKTHDRAWLARRRHLADISAPDVRAFRYPYLPFLGELPFRGDGDDFTAAPSARTLWQRNSTLVSRDVAEARPGDLLFFAVPHAPGSGLHTMIALGARAGATPEERVTRVVYHTGSDDDRGRGEVRVVSLADLARHPDAGWHPVAHNARFLGVHRLHHLHHETRVLAGMTSVGTP